MPAWNAGKVFRLLFALCICGALGCALSEALVMEAIAQRATADQLPADNPSTSSQVATAAGDGYETAVKPMIRQICSRCHNATKLKGGIDLERFLNQPSSSVSQNPGLWKDVVRMLKAGYMPPAGQPQLTPQQLTEVTGWINQQLAGSGPGQSPAAPAEPQAPANSAQTSGAVAALSGVSAKGFEADVKPLIRQSCSTCHNPTRLRGGLDLTRFLDETGEQALKERDVWERVAQKLQAGEMPPGGQPRPPAQKIAAATQFIQHYYAQQDRIATVDPGRVTARRLNRLEYTNTVRDLLGVNLRVADDFPPDPYAYGFDDIGDALSLSPTLTEMYMRAAERIARAAIEIGPPPKVLSVRYETQALGQQFRMHVETVHDFPVDGQYNLRFQWEQGEPLHTIMTGHIYLDGKEVLNQRIILTRLQDRAMMVMNVPVTQGPHLFEVQMEVAPDSEQPRPLHGVLPYPTVLEVVGPYHPKPFQQTASYKKIFFKGPPHPGDQSEYAREILARLATRAYRRPVTRGELDQLVGLTRLVHRHGGSFNQGIQVAIEGMLMSPNFLFRIEHDPPGDGPHHITDLELASRVSYFLWCSMPDDELLSLAEKGQLHQPGILHAQVRRMLADPRADSLASNFGEQWLETRNLEFQAPDAKTFPGYDVGLRDDMLTETNLFMESIIRQDRSILDLLDAKYTYLNDRLAKFYGIPGVKGRDFRRVDLTGTERGGILTQASVLTATSYPTRTSPTIRGKWILTNILNTPPPEPPANVPGLFGSDEDRFTSIRQRLEEHRKNPVCASCHAGMDPLGFALENYDAIGRWRTAEHGQPIDASGRLPDGTTFDGAAQLQAVLLAQSPKFIDAVTEKLLTYALGRGLEPYDRPAVTKIENHVRNNGDRFSALIDGIVDSAPFQMRHREESPAMQKAIASLESKSTPASRARQEQPQ